MLLCLYSCAYWASCAMRPLYHGSMLGQAFWPTWRIGVGPHHQHQRRTPTSPIPHLLLCFVSLLRTWAHGLSCALLSASYGCLGGALWVGWCVCGRGGMLHPGTWAHGIYSMRAERMRSAHIGPVPAPLSPDQCTENKAHFPFYRLWHPQGPVRMLPKGARTPKPPHTRVLCDHLLAGRLENGPIDKGQIAGTIAA